jgi:DNA-binding NtrC family response regulator
VESISPAAAQMLVAYKWPENIRELRNVIERAILVSDSGNWRSKIFLTG